MLKNVPQILPPELLKVLCEMGHTDRLLITDGNFPAVSHSKNGIVIRMDGHNVPEVLDAVLSLFPLDESIEHPVSLMEVAPGENVETPIWDVYKEIVAKYDKRGADAFCTIERLAYYEEAKHVYAILYTGEKALYANIMLQKGVIREEDDLPVYGRE